jgi:hypothetical protein
MPKMVSSHKVGLRALHLFIHYGRCFRPRHQDMMTSPYLKRESHRMRCSYLFAIENGARISSMSQPNDAKD